MPLDTQRIGVLLRHNLILVGRDPGHLIAYIVMPMVLMLLEAPLYRAAMRGSLGTTQVVTGMLVMFSLLALSIVGYAVLTERTWQTWDRLRATPAAPLELLIGKAGTILAVLVAQQAALLGFGARVLGLRVPGAKAMGLLCLAVLCWGVTLLAGGSALGLAVRSPGQLSAISDIAGLVLTGLGGALAPLSAMPGWARVAAPVSPGYWAMAALRAALSGDTVGTLRAVGVLLALAGVAAGYACWRVSRTRTRL